MTTQTTSESVPTARQARAWLQRWDDQQAQFFSDREERFQVIVDVVAHVVDRADPLIVDLGVGPGSLSERLLQRIPAAQIVGVDMDALLLGLCERAYGSDRFRVVRSDLRASGWLESLELPRRPDAFVSTTALHWLERPVLVDVLTEAVGALAPGGVIVDGDHLGAERHASRLDELALTVRTSAQRRVKLPAGESWQDWWHAVEQAPELAALWRARAQADLSHQVREHAVVDDYLQAFLDGGCSAAGQVWQVGDDRVVVGLR